MSHVAIFDVGSTTFQYGIGDPDSGTIRAVSATSTEPTRIIEQMTETIEELQGRVSEPLSGISIGSSGRILEDGEILFDWREDGRRSSIAFADELGGRFDMPVFLENDSNAAALGEYYFGDGGGHDCVAHVTFGTGIGGGVCIDGEVIRGEHGQAMEVGLVPLNVDDESNSFGVHGSWEAYCSGRGMPDYVARYIEEDGRETVLEPGEFDVKDVFDAARDGDALADDVLDSVGRYNAAGVGTVLSIFDPGLVTVSGSIATNNEQRVLGPIRNHVSDFTNVDPPTIRLSTIADRIGLYGALALYRSRSADGTHQ